MSKAFRTKYLFKKYLTNSCSSIEMEELFDLLNNENNLSLIEGDLEILWQQEQKTPFEHHVDLFEKFQTRIKTEKANSQVLPVKKFNYKWAIAACFIFMSGFLGYYFYKNPFANKSVINPIVQHTLNPAVKRIVLSDGSIVVLNKGSHLNYPDKFVGKDRVVYLTGEAYFDIKHDSKRPFLVHSGNLVTQVLGTAFNIKSGTGEHPIEVTVSRGKVSVSNEKKTLAVLLPNQKISYNQHSGEFVKEQTNANLTSLWKEEDLVLENLTIREAVKKINERYETNIIFDNGQIGDCKFTAYFLNTTELKQVIKVISKLNQLNYNVNDRGVYTLSGNGCK